MKRANTRILTPIPAVTYCTRKPLHLNLNPNLNLNLNTSTSTYVGSPRSTLMVYMSRHRKAIRAAPASWPKE